jgi:hypothetical protein
MIACASALCALITASMPASRPIARSCSPLRVQVLNTVPK